MEVRNDDSLNYGTGGRWDWRDISEAVSRGVGISLTEAGGRLAALGCWCLCVLAVHEAGIIGGQVGLEKKKVKEVLGMPRVRASWDTQVEEV